MSGPGPLIVAIDGPSGVGKGTVARRLADLLVVPYFDTGAMYRALGLKVLEEGVDPADEKAVLEVIEKVRLDLELRGPETGGGFEVLLDGEPVEPRIRSPEVSSATSSLSTFPAVRRRMVALQRDYGRRLGGVMEGRDIGTEVFPDTPYKFFLDARPDIRYERRFRQLLEGGREVSRDRVEREVRERDDRDRTREASPLKWDETYELIDTSDLDPDQVLDRILASIRERD